MLQVHDAVDDKLRDYRADYNNRPSTSISCMPAVANTSGRLHCDSELVRILFFGSSGNLFFAASGIELAETNLDFFHYIRAAFYSQLKSKSSKVGNILAKATSLRINLNIDGPPIASRSHTHPSHSQTSRIVSSSLSLGIPFPRSTCVRGF